MASLPETHASDGFFLNFCWIMLRLCLPFMTKEDVDFKKSKVLAIDVTYCSVQDKEAAKSVDIGGSMVDFSQDSKLVSYSSGQIQP